MALTPPFQLMLAEARRQLPPDGTRPWEWTAEQKADGFRAILFARSGQVLLQSRRGNDLTPAFPDIAAEALRLGESLVLDGSSSYRTADGWTSPRSGAARGAGDPAPPGPPSTCPPA
ncbi:hypothetical protein ACFTZF_48980 [Streptomyces mirabilis]|uniref:ATP-dependent DNA ligase n=1 Tax=Streptomyces mirabilis TaxID=68239 RepID=UPI003636C133